MGALLHYHLNSIQPDGVRSRIQGVGNAPHQALDAAEVLLLGGARWVHVVVASFCHGYGVWQAGGRTQIRDSEHRKLNLKQLLYLLGTPH